MRKEICLSVRSLPFYDVTAGPILMKFNKDIVYIMSKEKDHIFIFSSTTRSQGNEIIIK